MSNMTLQEAMSDNKYIYDKDINRYVKKVSDLTTGEVVWEGEKKPLPTPRPQPEQEYLNFTALEAGATVAYTKSTVSVAEWSTDKETWTQFVDGEAVTLENVGDKIYIQGKLSGAQSDTNYSYFTFTGQWNVAGDISTIFNRTLNNLTVPYNYSCRWLFANNPTVDFVGLYMPATTLKNYCYANMFSGCTGMTVAPELPATTLGSYCYNYMFGYCSSLVQGPSILPATALGNYPGCYQYMFRGCTSLISAPALPSTSLGSYCYQYMFYDCSSLTEAPELPATTLTGQCYQYMFYGCSSLVHAPALPAKSVTESCYRYMFYECTSLVDAPDLPSIGTASYCYQYMFYGCTSLVDGPTIFGMINYATAPCQHMFENCTSLRSLKIYAYAWTANNTLDWLKGVSETGDMYSFRGVTPTTGTSGKPSGWTLHKDNSYLTISALTKEATVKYIPSTVSTAKYSYDKENWYFFDNETVTLNNIGDHIYVKGTISGNQSADDYAHFETTGRLNVSGDISNLINEGFGVVVLPYTYTFYKLFEGTSVSYITDLLLPSGENTKAFCYAYMFANCENIQSTCRFFLRTVTESCCEGMFMGCTSLTYVYPFSALSNYAVSCFKSMFEGCTSLTTLTNLGTAARSRSCFERMFKGCTSLTKIPIAQTSAVAVSCYESMFEGCTSLTSYGNQCSATTHAQSCCKNMFKGCTGITSVSALPATTLAESSCEGMFEGCTSLTTVSKFAATTVAPYSCKNMFKDCTSLKTVPYQYSATTMEESCYEGMFYNCSSLTVAPLLKGTTLATNCYKNMFYNCSNIDNVTVYAAEWSTDDCENWLYGVAEDGDFTNAGGAEIPSSASGIPTTWYERISDYLNFTAVEAGSTITYTKSTVSNASYSTDKETWTPFYTDGGEQVTVTLENVGDKVYIKGKVTGNQTTSNYAYFTITGLVDLAGDISSLHNETLFAYSLNIQYEFYNLFNHCPIRDASGLLMPARSLGQRGVYMNMFRYCANLISAPKIIECTSMTSYTHSCMFSDCTSLVNAPKIPAKSISGNSYEAMFQNCTSLVTAPYMPFEHVERNGCYHMFYNCTSLVNVQETLPAMSLVYECYDAMFENCTSLVTAPNLPATTFPTTGYSGYYGYYEYMFRGCTSLVNPPILSAMEVPSQCYNQMFKGCTSLVTAPDLPATKVLSGGYYGMFEGCTSLTNVPVMDVVNAAGNTFERMFYGCTSLTDVPSIKAAGLGNKGCSYMFYNCKALTTAPEILATTVGVQSCEYMFSSCTGLTTARIPQATTLAEKCYYNMFQGCTSLTTTPELPATTLAKSCYERMFYNCKALVNIPSVLPVMDLVYGCYAGMFRGCTSLTTVPELPATNLGEYCYSYMFQGCTSLVNAMELPATTLADYCYRYMFANCTKLEYGPSILPAEVLTPSCYTAMFTGCSKLKEPPIMSATTLASNCCYSMFESTGSLGGVFEVYAESLAYQCFVSMFRWSSIKVIKVHITEWNTTDPMNWLGNLPGAAGDFYNLGEADIPRSASGIPTNWRVHVPLPNYLCFTAQEANSTVTYTPSTVSTAEYSGNGENWQTFDNQTVTLANVGDKIYVRGVISGDQGSYNNKANFTGTGKVKLSGDISTMINRTANVDTLPYKYMFSRMFYNNTSIVDCEDLVLPAMTLSEGCYEDMFMYCSNLTKVPERLPALTLVDSCYCSMFLGTAITSAPEIMAETIGSYSCYCMFEDCDSLTSTAVMHATNMIGDCCCVWMYLECHSLVNATVPPVNDLSETYSCYYEMFYGCTSLTTAPELPATILCDDCYMGMFSNCTSLVTSPELLATNLAVYCYCDMFYNCTSLVTAPELPATTLTNSCYADMFYGCTSLVNAPELPAVTLKDYCYASMFYGCTSLVNAPELPATTLNNGCYERMFYECANINKIITYATSWEYYATNWLSGTSLNGDFYNLGKADIPIGSDGIPTGWTEHISSMNIDDYLTFTAVESNSTITYMPSTVTSAFYSTDNGITWNTWNNTAVTLTNTGDSIKVKGKMIGNQNSSDYARFRMSGKIAASGNIMSIYDNGNDKVSIFKEYAFYRLFDYCTSLITPPELPVIAVSVYCYCDMFYNCTSLVTAPELPAISLKNYCYYSMFRGCTSLTATPDLPANELAYGCYQEMFRDCSSLITIMSELPATVLAEYCYYGMFNNCTSIVNAPNLPANSISYYGYSGMFYNCTSLLRAPELMGEFLSGYCYDDMFYNCRNVNRIVVGATYWVNNCSGNWLNGASTTGDFYNLGGATISTGVSGIPEGWTEHILPEDYEQLEYIESTTGAYIKDCIYITHDGRVELGAEYEHRSGTDCMVFYGANSWFEWYTENSFYTRYFSNSSLRIPTAGITGLPRADVDIRKQSVIINGSSGYEIGYNESVDPVLISIFARTSGTGYFTGKLYYFRNYDALDQCVNNLIPARNTTTNVCGLYDTVTGTFYGSSNDIQFTGGEIVSE